MKPGPKGNGPCPPELHARLPEDTRIIIDSFGPGTVNERLVKALKEAGKAHPPVTLPELKGRLITLTREHRFIGKAIGECTQRLQDLGQSEEDINSLFEEIKEILEKEAHD